MGKRWIICKVSQAAQSPTYWWFCIGTPICSSFSNLHRTFDVATYCVYRDCMVPWKKKTNVCWSEQKFCQKYSVIMLLISKRRTRKNVKEAKMSWDVGVRQIIQNRKQVSNKQTFCWLFRCLSDKSWNVAANMYLSQICAIFPSSPLFSSWRSLLTFLCLGNFHFHSHTWNIQICLLLASKAGQMQQLFENKILQFPKVRGRGGADYGLFRISSWQYTKCPSLSSSIIYTYSTGNGILLLFLVLWSSKYLWYLTIFDKLRFGKLGSLHIAAMLCNWMLEWRDSDKHLLCVTTDVSSDCDCWLLTRWMSRKGLCRAETLVHQGGVVVWYGVVLRCDGPPGRCGRDHGPPGRGGGELAAIWDVTALTHCDRWDWSFGWCCRRGKSKNKMTKK